MLSVLVGCSNCDDSRIERRKLDAQGGRSIADAGDDNNVGCEGRFHGSAQPSRWTAA